MIGAALVCYGFHNVAVSVVTFATAGFCNALLYPIQSDSLNDLIPSEQRATLISVDSMFFSIAMILVFPAAGAAADVFGLTGVLVGIGAGLWLFVGTWLIFKVKNEKRLIK